MVLAQMDNGKNMELQKVEQVNRKLLPVVIGWCLLIAMFFYGCGYHYEPNNIYEKIPKETELSEGLLRASGQVYVYNGQVILVCDTFNIDDRYNPSLLFFNEHHRLNGACYFIGQKIDMVRNDTLYANINHSREDRKFAFTNDVPPSYTIRYTDTLITRWDSRSDEIIDSIHIDERFMVKLYIRMAVSIYLSPDNIEDSSASFFSKFIRPETRTCSLNELSFYYPQNQISFVTVNAASGSYEEKMIFYNRKTFDDFYHHLFLLLTKKAVVGTPVAGDRVLKHR